MFSSFVVMLLMVGSAIALFTDFYKDQRVSRLQRTNHALSNQLQHMSGKVNQLESQIQIIEKQDDGLRLAAGLPRIDEDLLKVGTGGSYGDYVDVDLNSLPDALQEETKKVNVLLAELERRVNFHSENVSEVKDQLTENLDRLKHTPSIRPVLPELSRITDGYGMRYHPLIERKKHHDGVDIAAEIGTEVNAVASGVVEKAQALASFGHGYGKYVVINHGYGYKTLYGHLSKVLVQEGQKVERWELIGLVGTTGMTTGPHVHFEVHMNDAAVDPEAYILN